jgi:hypothetical protein
MVISSRTGVGGKTLATGQELPSAERIGSNVCHACELFDILLEKELSYLMLEEDYELPNLPPGQTRD